MARPLARALRALHDPAVLAELGGQLPFDPIRRADMAAACRRWRADRIIDWVDVCRSDPGVDLQLAWSMLPPAARDEFVDEYGPVAEESLLRARVVALFLYAILARYGSAGGDADSHGRGARRPAPLERGTLARVA